MDTSQIMVLLMPVIVPAITSLVRGLALKVNKDWPAYLTPLKAWAIAYALQWVYKQTGVVVPKDLSTIDPAVVQTLLTNTTVLTGVSVLVREAVDQAKKAYVAWKAKSQAPKPAA